MNYTNYERAVVERHGVALINWPLPGKVQNPGKVGGRNQVETLLNALKSGKCKWVSLSEEELRKRREDNEARQARGEEVYVLRKRRGAPTRRDEVVDTDSTDSTDSNEVGAEDE